MSYIDPFPFCPKPRSTTLTPPSYDNPLDHSEKPLISRSSSLPYSDPLVTSFPSCPFSPPAPTPFPLLPCPRREKRADGRLGTWTASSSPLYNDQVVGWPSGQCIRQAEGSLRIQEVPYSTLLTAGLFKNRETLHTTMALVPANSLMGAARTTDDHPGYPVVTLFTGQDNIRAAMEEFCVNVSN